MWRSTGEPKGKTGWGAKPVDRPFESMNQSRTMFVVWLLLAFLFTNRITHFLFYFILS
ncbi:hypothetical protein T492DRAFT_925641, partial [Pavlovales sp. CCMP2436]